MSEGVLEGCVPLLEVLEHLRILGLHIPAAERVSEGTGGKKRQKRIKSMKEGRILNKRRKNGRF